MSASATRGALNRLRKQSAFRWVAVLQRRMPTATVYLVGGTVRDFFIGRPTNDYDFVIRGIPAPKLEGVLKKLGRVDFVGRRFGVYKFKPRGSALTFDIALPRTERSLSHRGSHRDFEIVSDFQLPIEEDLTRRDFTINALALEWQSGLVIDTATGVADIRRKKIRTIGAPAERFAEDYIRMLRAIRFACELGFTIEPATLRSIQKLGIYLRRNDVPTEPIAKELTRAFAADPVRALALLESTRLLRTLVPEFSALQKKTARVLLRRVGDMPVTARFALLLYPLDRRAGTVARRLKLSAGEPAVAITTLRWLIAESKRLLSGKGTVPRIMLEKDFFADRERGLLLRSVCRAIAGLRPQWQQRLTAIERECKRLAPQGRLPQPLITGSDVLRAGIAAGPRIATILQHVREEQLNKKIRTRAQAIRLMKAYE